MGMTKYRKGPQRSTKYHKRAPRRTGITNGGDQGPPEHC